MTAIVVYESHWGNTAAVARAIAEGLGPGSVAMPTDAAVDSVVASADLLIVGAPVVAFGLPRAAMRQQIAGDVKAPTPPDLSHPLLRDWLDALPIAHAWGAALAEASARRT
ncbi:MAG: flavodoxin family protein [Acidimicrobiales bacterium]